MENKKIQFMVNPSKDEVLYNLIQRLESKTESQKGYVNDQLKERLKVFELLSRQFNEEDPTALAILLSAGQSKSIHMATQAPTLKLDDSKPQDVKVDEQKSTKPKHANVMRSIAASAMSDIAIPKES